MKFLLFPAWMTVVLTQQLVAQSYGLTDNDIEHIEHEGSLEKGQETRTWKNTFVHYLKSIKDHHTVYEQGKTISYSDLHQWELFKIEYEREYKSEQEERTRKAIFLDNLKTINDHNAKYHRGETTFYMGVNQFADMTLKEFQDTMTGLRIPAGYKRTGQEFVYNDSIPLPKTVDWRKKGAVTPVKKQGKCGSDYAFSATGSVEGITFVKTGKLVSLSEQNLVDCSKAQGNKGCHGGLVDIAFKYIERNSGIDTEDSYPYEAKEGKCRYSAKDKGADIFGYIDTVAGDENDLKAAVALEGPVSAAIDASQPSFKSYNGGLYKEPKCSSLQVNHAVLVVGYGVTKEGPYWLVKNCWGERWGMKGYMLMPRNKNNTCGIATMASFPMV